jgi:hypothetical protein
MLRLTNASHSNNLYVVTKCSTTHSFLSSRDMYSVSYRLFKNWSSNPPQFLKFEAEADLNNIQKLSPYRKENTTLHHYKDQLVNAV